MKFTITDEQKGVPRRPRPLRDFVFHVEREDHTKLDKPKRVRIASHCRGSAIREFQRRKPKSVYRRITIEEHEESF